MGGPALRGWKVLAHRALFCLCLALSALPRSLAYGRRRRLAGRLSSLLPGAFSSREAKRLAAAVLLHQTMARLDALFPAATTVRLSRSARSITPSQPVLILPTSFPVALRHWRGGILARDGARPGPLVIVRVERTALFRCTLRAFPLEGSGECGGPAASRLRPLLAENPAWFPWESNEVSELFSEASQEES